jgi:hypothetical protein
MAVGPVRTPLIAAALLLVAACTAACADAPITAADLQADGQLRETSSQQSVHSASESNQAPAQRAEHLRVTGLLAVEAEGPLEDATRFALDTEVIYLHLRADELTEPRPVTFVWTHSTGTGDGEERVEERRETMGFLQPSQTVSVAASLPLARFIELGGLEAGALEAEAAAADPVEVETSEIAPLTGEWKLEVYSVDATGRNLVFERVFEIFDPLAEAEAQ